MDMAVVKKPLAVGVKEIRAWIESGEPRSVIDVSVTPEIARLLLKQNIPGETNRLQSRTYVTAAVEAMKKSEWVNTGEPIIISDEGLLNDGQHRLQAIVETGLPCIMDLRFGIRRRAFINTNSGRKRTGADALVIAGATETTRLSAIARLVICYDAGLPGALWQRVGNGQIVDAVERWPELQTAARIVGLVPQPMRNSATGALACFALRTANQASVDEFFSILRSGEGKASNPPHALRDFLTVSPVARGHDNGARLRALAACILAWNAWLTNKDGKLNLYWKENQKFPVCEGLKL